MLADAPVFRERGAETFHVVVQGVFQSFDRLPPGLDAIAALEIRYFLRPQHEHLFLQLRTETAIKTNLAWPSYLSYLIVDFLQVGFLPRDFLAVRAVLAEQLVDVLGAAFVLRPVRFRGGDSMVRTERFVLFPQRVDHLTRKEIIDPSLSFALFSYLPLLGQFDGGFFDIGRSVAFHDSVLSLQTGELRFGHHVHVQVVFRY